MSSSGAAALSGGGAIDKGMVLCSFDPTGEWFAYVTHDNRLKVRERLFQPILLPAPQSHAALFLIPDLLLLLLSFVYDAPTGTLCVVSVTGVEYQAQCRITQAGLFRPKPLGRDCHLSLLGHHCRRGTPSESPLLLPFSLDIFHTELLRFFVGLW